MKQKVIKDNTLKVKFLTMSISSMIQKVIKDNILKYFWMSSLEPETFDKPRCRVWSQRLRLAKALGLEPDRELRCIAGSWRESHLIRFGAWLSEPRFRA